MGLTTDRLAASTGTAERRSGRPRWRSVAIPKEHGGWGLTAEPVLLGLLVAPSAAGALLGAAALLAFLVRTPLKLVSIDARHRRWTARSRLAVGVAAIELASLVLLGVVAVLLAGWSWVVPVIAATPLVVVEWSFDSRGRGRRLVPELAGAVGIGGAAAAIVLAGDGSSTLAAGLWLVVAARAVGSIPFVRIQIGRLRKGLDSVRSSDAAQLAALVIGSMAVALDGSLLAGAVGLGLLALVHIWSVRRPAVPAKRLGLTETFLGLALVLVTAAGVAAV